MTLRRIRMFCFRNFILIFPLSFLLNGCGYTVPDYIDAQRFKNISQFITIAKEQQYQPISIRSITEIALNQNVTGYICGEEQKRKICVLPHHQPYNREMIKKIDIPIAKEHESYLLLNESNHLFVLSKDLSRDNQNSSESCSIIGFEIDLNHTTVRKLDIINGQQIRNELIDSLIQEKKYRKKNDDEVNFDGVIYEELNNADVTQPTNDLDENEFTLLNILEVTYKIIQQLVQNIASLFQDLSSTLIYKSGYTISDQTITFDDLPESFPTNYHDKLLSQLTQVDCLHSFSPNQMDYLVQQQGYSRLFINIPLLDTLIEDQKIKLCNHPSLQEVTNEKIIHQVVTGNRSSGNHYIAGYSPEGFNIFELNNVQFQAPLNELSIYQKDQQYIIEFPKSKFYLIPK